MNIEGRPTPEVDAEAYEPNGSGEWVVGAKFAQNLERQKAALREALEEALIVIERSKRNLSNHGFDHTGHLFKTIENATNQARAILAATKPTP